MKHEGSHSIIGGGLPLSVNHPYDDNRQDVTSVRSGLTCDGSFSQHKKWNHLDGEARLSRHADATAIQAAWPESSLEDWFPRDLLPHGHPFHPLNMSGAILKELRELAEATRGNIERAHEALRIAPALRGYQAGGLIGVADIKSAFKWCIKQAAREDLRREQEEERMQQQGSPIVSPASDGALASPLVNVDQEMQDTKMADDDALASHSVKADQEMQDTDMADPSTPPQHVVTPDPAAQVNPHAELIPRPRLADLYRQPPQPLNHTTTMHFLHTVAIHRNGYGLQTPLAAHQSMLQHIEAATGYRMS